MGGRGAKGAADQPDVAPWSSFALLAERSFPTDLRIEGWDKTVKLAGKWRANILSTTDVDGQSISCDPRGVSLRWSATSSRVRLFQPLSLAGLPEGAKHYDLDLQVVGSKDPALEAAIEWAAVLVVDPVRGAVLHRRIALSSLGLVGAMSLVGHAERVEIDPSREYRLCFQFRTSSGEIRLKHVNLTARIAVSAQETPTLIPVPNGAGAPRAEAASPASRSAEAATESKARARGAPAAAPQSAAPLRSPKPPARAVKQKIAVIAWDAGHNPVGRAFLLADMLSRRYEVELIAPQFDRYGDEVWPPIAKGPVKIRTFPASKMGDFLHGALKIAESVQPDYVYVCKPRLPSLLIGMLIRHRTGAPVILDVDDHELSFFDDQQPLALSEIEAALGDADAELPYAKQWTRLAESLIPTFDHVTVSNPALLRKFGGVVVRHARDEAVFGRNPAVRATVRAEFGYGDDDAVILFLGTPRAHKGVFRVADALERIGDPRLRLCIVGSINNRGVEKTLRSYKNARIDLHPDQPWSRLPALMNLADAVCLLQDVDSPISHYQIPAKLTDALASGARIAVTDVEPFGDLPREPIVTRVDGDDELEAFLRSLLEPEQRESDGRALRSYYLGEFSYRVNNARLQAVIEEADRLRSRDWPEEWSDLLAALAARWSAPLPTASPAWADDRLAYPALKRRAPFDLVMFWKQNDTGIYGRRHDMLMKYLSRHERVGRIVQFDAPIAVDALLRTHAPEAGMRDQRSFVLANTLGRFLKTSDTNGVLRRVFVHQGRTQTETLLDAPLRKKEDYVDWIKQELREAGVSGSAVGWFAPVIADFPQISREIRFSATVADIIDDQRVMPSTPAHRAVLEQSYLSMLGSVDVALANCASAAEAFRDIRSDIQIVPNAAEPEREIASRLGDRPYEMARLTGPIIGYVGNLRDRVDVPLIRRIASSHQGWNVVLLGSAHGQAEALSLADLPNVRFLGVRPYEEALSYIKAFHVAIMPHLDNEVSRRMNPLKLYVYAAVGVPIVTTRVANIDEAAPFASVAEDGEDFLRLIEQKLGESAEGRRRPLKAGMLWPARVASIMRILDDHAG